MNKSFVNPTQETIVGDSKISDKKKEIKQADLEDVTTQSKKTDQQIAQEVLTKPIVLKHAGTHKTLLGIGVDPKLTTASKDTTFKVLDDGIEIFTISKNALITACQAIRESDRLKGITYSVPLFAHAVIIDYQFQNVMTTIGDITGIQFYFKK